VHEVPRPQPALLALDEQDALAGQHEKVLLVGLAVVQPARVARLQHRERVADLRERRRVALDHAGVAERLVAHPRRVADVDDEPALGRGDEARLGPLHARLPHHALERTDPAVEDVKLVLTSDASPGGEAARSIRLPPMSERARVDPPPKPCRFGMHQWPATFLPGAGPVRCLRCGAERADRWWRRGFWDTRG
jgi:hypothetical protein